MRERSTYVLTEFSARPAHLATLPAQPTGGGMNRQANGAGFAGTASCTQGAPHVLRGRPSGLKGRCAIADATASGRS